MADLGITEKESAMTVPFGESKEPRYPGLTLRDDQVKRVKGSHECNVGDEYDAYVKLRVKGISDDEFGSRLEFDVLNMDEFTPTGEASTDVAEDEAPVDEKPGKSKTPNKALTYS